MMTATSLVGLLCLMPLLATACDNTSPCNFTGGDDYVTPIEVSSSDGFLDYTLTVDISDVTIEWLVTQRRTYNGGFPGPTFRLKAGDNFNLTLVNNLSPQPPGVKNEFRDPNTTNVHTHGLHISPVEPQDYVLLEVGPGETYKYQFELNPNQQAGTFWYHAHHHGSTFFHVGSGLAGLLIVEDEPSSMSAELAAISCPDNCGKEVPMLLGDFVFYTRGPTTFADVQADIGDPFLVDDTTITTAGVTLLQWLTDEVTGLSQYLVNGQYQPVVTMQPGEIRRFRMVNAGPKEMLIIKIAGCEMKILAYDGAYVDTPYFQDFIFLPAGGRTDAAVRCGKHGTYNLRSELTSLHQQSIGDTDVWEGIIAKIHVIGNAVQMDFPSSTPTNPPYHGDMRNVPDSEIGGRYVVEIGSNIFLNREKWTDGTYYRYNFNVDTIQEWVLTNSNVDEGHPLHMHVAHFQVISYNAYNGPVIKELGEEDSGVFAFYDMNGNICEQQYKDFNSSLAVNSITVDKTFHGHDTNDRNLAGYARIGEFRDVLLIPPLASITVRFNATDYVGPYILHCHFLDHEDTGMMMVTRATPPGEATASQHESSGGHNPGTCRSTDRYPEILDNLTNSGSKTSVFIGWMEIFLLLMATSFNCRFP